MKGGRLFAKGARNSLALVLISLLPALVAAQTPSSSGKAWGTINGKPIPDAVFTLSGEGAENIFILHHEREPKDAADEQEIDAIMRERECRALEMTITNAAREEEKQRLKMAVTQQDIAWTRRVVTTSDPAMEAALFQAILGGISAVYDKHEDPNQVYDRMPKEHQVPKGMWLEYLHRASTPEGRRRVEQEFQHRLTIDRQRLGSTESSMEFWRRVAEDMKRDETVDQHIGATDPTFRAYLAEYRNSFDEVRGARVGMDPGHLGYLSKKRTEFWNAQVSKLDIRLSDPSLAQTCNLSAIGVQAVRR